MLNQTKTKLTRFILAAILALTLATAPTIAGNDNHVAHAGGECGMSPPPC